jgi:transglutaminase-like putative cysteine protease
MSSVRRYSILHETRYRYASPVALSQQLLHLSPRTLEYQVIREHRIAADPPPDERAETLDYFGNSVARMAFLSPHSQLNVRAESLVDVSPRGLSAKSASEHPWENVRDRRTRADAAEMIEASEFAHESPLVGVLPQLLSYARRSFAPGRPLLRAVIDLNRRIHEEFEFDSKATTVSTPLLDVLEQRRGVCQDFSHLMIGCLRSFGIAARYVSGYILTHPPPGRPRLIGADASHAWVSVFVPDTGWIDVDPTNNQIVDTEHITLAWGRDFSDVTPMRGVILGGGEQELDVRVTVTPLD